MPKYDLRYSTSHLIPPRTFLEWTGSVVGWYGLLAPEIMEVLEASPSKPSASSVLLMMIILGVWVRGGEKLDSWLEMLTPTLTNLPGSTSRRRLCDRKHTLFHAGWKWMEKTNQTVHFSWPPRRETAASGRGKKKQAGIRLMWPCDVSSWLQCCVSPLSEKKPHL